MNRLPAEWEAQDAVMLTWPQPDSDWISQFAAVNQLYLDLSQQLSQYLRVIIAVDPGMIATLNQELDSRVNTANRARICCYAVKNNDTWARDHGPIAIEKNGAIELLDFTFNGWGNKFPAEQDNLISRELHAQGAFGQTTLNSVDLVLEGGGIESNGKGLLLANSQCVLNKNRNPTLDKHRIEQRLKQLFGLDQILWLNHGYLAGDDTDSHIDTLARFGPNNQILYVSCDDPTDEHYAELQKMQAELQAFRRDGNAAFELLPLPWPSPKYHEDGHRIPASYANYLVTNGAVFVPTYDDDMDQRAMAIIASVYPDRNLHGIPCLPLIKQHGSLHCITMQLPRGTLLARKFHQCR